MRQFNAHIKIISLGKIALLASALLISNYSQAACRLTDASGNSLVTPLYASATVGNWSIPRDKVVGSKETTYTHPWNTIATSCSGGTVQTTAEISGGKLVPGYTNTYETGIPGIGIQFRAAVPGISNTQVAPFNMTAQSDGAAQNFNSGVTLVVTGPVQSGTVTGSALPTMTWRATQGSTRISYVLGINGTLTVTSQTCKVDKSSINVRMPRVTTADLKDVGSTAGDTNFSIDLNSCATGIGVYLTLTDVANPSNTSNILSPNDASSAKGVSYQILHNSSPVNFGPDSATAGNRNQWSIGMISGESVSIPLTARYLRTSKTVTSGTASGQASFTLSYQ
ncbi:fimbrial protein [Burkholderia ubonensis]|uniref:fimbrial protein n=1 Tax=Burkholderia ubonensis TaxID=101571 RepID=UPI00358E99C1